LHYIIIIVNNKTNIKEKGGLPSEIDRDSHKTQKDAAENLVKGHGRTLSVKEPWTESHVVVVAQCEICFLEKGPSVVAAPRGHDYQLTLTALQDEAFFVGDNHRVARSEAPIRRRYNFYITLVNITSHFFWLMRELPHDVKKGAVYHTNYKYLCTTLQSALEICFALSGHLASHDLKSAQQQQIKSNSLAKRRAKKFKTITLVLNYNWSLQKIAEMRIKIKILLNQNWHELRTIKNHYH
ncbi:hypothetical protein ACJX0J_037212, partial [Zea mays]